MSETPDNRFSPNMERLKAELGRTPPPPPETKAEDYAPKKVSKWLGTANLSQGIKEILHDSPSWTYLSNPQREALELIASAISRICTEDPHDRAPWAAMIEFTTLGMEGCD
jgi:hypothetical protein